MGLVGRNCIKLRAPSSRLMRRTQRVSRFQDATLTVGGADEAVSKEVSLQRAHPTSSRRDRGEPSQLELVQVPSRRRLTHTPVTAVSRALSHRCASTSPSSELSPFRARIHQIRFGSDCENDQPNAGETQDHSYFTPIISVHVVDRRGI